MHSGSVRPTIVNQVQYRLADGLDLNMAEDLLNTALDSSNVLNRLILPRIRRHMLKAQHPRYVFLMAVEAA
jgi:hypothetical protein